MCSYRKVEPTQRNFAGVPTHQRGTAWAGSCDQASATGGCSRKRARSCMFCFSAWSTPDKIAFQGHPPGQRSNIPSIEVASCRESFSRCSVGKRRPAIRPAITPPSKAISNDTLFILTRHPPRRCPTLLYKGMHTAAQPARSPILRQAQDAV